MAGVALSGMASGLDTEGIITQLMQIESRPKTLMQVQQKAISGRKTALDDVARQLRALSTAADDLKSILTWGTTQKVTSSDDTKVGARITGSAPAGNVTIDVVQLARSEQRTYDWTATASADINGTTIDLSGATTVQDAAAAINANSATNVYAGVVNGQLVLTGRNLGESISVTGLTEDTTGGKQLLAQSTIYKVNGIQQDPTTESVVQPGGLPGVELTIKNTGTVTLSTTPPGADTDKVKEKIKAFVTAYNSAIDFVNTKLSEKPMKTPVTDDDYAVGALAGDFRLMTLVTDLRKTVQPLDATGSSVMDTLAEIGVSVPKATSDGSVSTDGLAGHLVIDDAKLDAALASDPDQVRALLGGSGTDGVAQALSAVLDPVAKTSTGYLATSSASADTEIKDYDDRIADMDRRLSLKEQRLRAQFTALETALSQSQAQQAWIAGQIGGLATWS